MPFKATLPFILATLLSHTAKANDHLKCRFNLKRGPHTQAFQLNQVITAERKPLNYSVPTGRDIQVTESEIPFEVFMGWDKFSAKITYRHALERINSTSRVRAAQWTCFEAMIETIDGQEEISCQDKGVSIDPFADQSQRWHPTQVINNTPVLEPDESFKSILSSRGDILSVDCTLITKK